MVPGYAAAWLSAVQSQVLLRMMATSEARTMATLEGRIQTLEAQVTLAGVVES